jgi:hypothetical protein
MFSNEIENLFGDVWEWMQNIGGLLFFTMDASLKI